MFGKCDTIFDNVGCGYWNFHKSNKKQGRAADRIQDRLPHRGGNILQSGCADCERVFFNITSNPTN